MVPNGRTVRCAKCGNSWTEQPAQDMPHSVEIDAAPAAPVPAAPAVPAPAPDPVPAPAPAPTPEPAPATAPTEISFDETPEASDDEEDFDMEVSVPEPDDDDDFDVPDMDDFDLPEITTRSSKPKRGKKARGGRDRSAGGGRRIGLIVGWVVLMLVIVGVAGGGLFGRDMIIAAWPPAAKLYETIGLGDPPPGFGLDLRNVRSGQKEDGGKVILTITGTITNTTDTPQPIPKLRGALLDSKRKPIHDWLFTAPKAQAAPGEKVEFSTSVTSPPAAARGLAVTFMEREPAMKDEPAAKKK